MRNFLIILTIFSASLRSDDHTIAVLDFIGAGVHGADLQFLSEQFRLELLKQDTLRVMDYNDMIQILSIAGYEKPQCTTLECAIISSMLLETEWMVTVNITKIGEVFVSEARLYESLTGRVINLVNYDHELSMEGLKTRGMHNLAEMLMSTRIPMEFHQRQNLIYIKTKPSGAMVRVGKDTLSGVTPMALDRVMVESRPIIIVKKGFEPFRIKQLPDDISDIIYIELQHLVPQIGHVAFGDSVPDDIVIVSEDGEIRYLIDEGAIEYLDLGAGKYTLESGKYIIHNGDFRIRHRRTSQLNPEFHEIAHLEKQRDRYKLKRNIMIGSLILSAGYRGYLQYESDNLYTKYEGEILEGDQHHRKIEQLDQLKPAMEGLSALMIFPIIYYHVKYLQIKKWLRH